VRGFCCVYQKELLDWLFMVLTSYEIYAINDVFLYIGNLVNLTLPWFKSARKPKNKPTDYALSHSQKIIENYNVSVEAEKIRSAKRIESFKELQNIIRPLGLNILDCNIDTTIDATFGCNWDTAKAFSVLEAEVDYILSGEDEKSINLFNNLIRRGHHHFKELLLINFAPYAAAVFTEAENPVTKKCYEWNEIIEKSIKPSITRLYELENAHFVHVTIEHLATVFSLSSYDSMLLEVSYVSQTWISPFDLSSVGDDSTITAKKELAMRQIIFPSNNFDKDMPLVTSIIPVNQIHKN
jgi:hypothetical protein